MEFPEPVESPPCDAEIVMSVDGDERRWPVRLVDGAVPYDATLRTVKCVE